MPRMKAPKQAELETFWRAHLEGWRQSALNQREYCEAHGLPLKRFGNWRAKFRHEDPPAGARSGCTRDRPDTFEESLARSVLVPRNQVRRVD